MLEIRDLVVRYGDLTAVDGLSLTVESGTLFGFLGPNGAGKSTTLNCVASIREPTSGSITIDGVDVAKDPIAARALLGLVPQSLALYEPLSVVDNLRCFAGLAGLRGKRRRDRIEWGLALAQLEARKDTLVSTLSGGMKRRLNLAASLLHDPKLVLCDEPTAGVDPQSRNHLFDTIRKLNEEGRTVIYTTHYMEEVEALCSRVAIIDKGKLIANDTLGALLEEKGESTRFLLDIKEAKSRETVKALLEHAGLDFSALTQSAHTLEDVFLDLTGRALRDVQ